MKKILCLTKISITKKRKIKGRAITGTSVPVWGVPGRAWRFFVVHFSSPVLKSSTIRKNGSTSFILDSSSRKHTRTRTLAFTHARRKEATLARLGSELGDLEGALPSGSWRDTIPREASLQSRVTETDSALSSRPRPGPRVTSHPAAG